MSARDARGAWTSGLGFVMATAGAAIGLGNVWRFPYITGANGGGLFVLIYLACIALVGLPIMIAELMIGRSTRLSTVSAFKSLTGPRSPWVGLGWLGIAGAFLVLSFYCVVSAWTLRYTVLAASGGLAGRSPDEIRVLFEDLVGSPWLSLVWLSVFMLLTVAVVLRGVKDGLERWSKILVPVLFVLLGGLLVRSFFLDGFGEGSRFVFGLHAERLSGGGVLEALGHAFFTLGAGLGGLLTYGSYLEGKEDIVVGSVVVCLLDTVVALVCCLILFAIIFSYGLPPSQGPGLIFVILPIAFAQMPGGAVLGALFFLLLFFAALTSAISILEVSTAYFVDERGWRRKSATLFAAGVTMVLAIPCALSGGGFFGGGMRRLVGKDWLAFVSDLATNWMAPLGGLGIALFVAWRLGEARRRLEFSTSRARRFYGGWLLVLRYVVPVAMLGVFFHAVGLF